MTKTKPTPKIYQLKISLKGIRPAIWRSFQVRGDISLIKLHDVIQRVMGWQDYHLYYFEAYGVEYGDPALVEEDLGMVDASRLTVDFAFPRVRSKCGYVYDFGDQWEHKIVLEKKLEPVPGERYPICIDGARRCPPEDCGGDSGYAELLEVLADPNHEDYDDMKEWVGPRFDRERFNPGAVNRLLSRRVVVKVNGG